MTYKTPGVYVKETSKFPPSVAQVETAIPAFIGYTEEAADENGQDLTNKPVKISSLVEYQFFFGGPYIPEEYTVTLDGKNNPDTVDVKRFYLFNSLRAFFDNGGGSCYIVSVGDYTDDIDYYDDNDPANPLGLKVGLDALVKYDEPTLILFPDAVGADSDGSPALSATKLGSLQADTLRQCNKLQDRFGIFDVRNGFQEGSSPIDDFRNKIGTNNLKYGAAYYPWLIASYNHTFRLRNVVAGPGTPIIDVSLPANTELDPLKTIYQQEVARTELIVGALPGLTLNDFGSLSEHYQKLVAELKSIPSSQPSAVSTKIQEILVLFRNAILAYDTIENGSSLGTDLTNQINTLRDDDPDLHDAIIGYISFEKNASVLSEISDLADESAVETGYNAYDSNNDWLAGNTNSFTAVADIPALGPGELDLTTPGNTKNKAIAATNYLDNNIDPDKLLGGLESLFDIALHNEELAEQQLVENYPLFKQVVLAIEREMRLLPPSGYVAGVYAATDNSRGVWKAPANMSLNNVISPAIKIDSADQESLNVHATGKSINVIRNFTGKGVLVWGARTLDGNSNEWRYVSVRRFFNMVEESVKKASEVYVFEPNDANTWVKVRSMIKNYLTTLWRQGALAGASPTDAFYVNIGLGETMTALDILEGRMIVEIGMATARPAEFIILKFSHKMQNS